MPVSVTISLKAPWSPPSIEAPLSPIIQITRVLSLWPISSSVSSSRPTSWSVCAV